MTHQLTYTPPADFVGQVNFMFQVVDGKGGSATASIDIKVLPVNDAPTANAQSVSTDEDTALAIQLSPACQQARLHRRPDLVAGHHQQSVDDSAIR